MWYGWNEGMGLWMFLGGLLSLGFLIGLILLIVWGFKQLTRRPPENASSDSALDIARERYARGELTSEQFEDIKRNLSRY
ncbi:MAG: SHOCT domain-containing protein [Dehalogenimonas sp.]